MKRVAVGILSLILALFMASLGGLPASASASGQGHSSRGSSSASNPPGNNGTVKIEENPAAPGDSGPDNDPHVACQFQINFYGFDSDQHSASVTITPVAPTAGSGSYTTSAALSGTRPPGNTLDGSLPVSQSDLSSALTGVTPQQNQGYHLRLDVTVGTGHKYKVFWLEPCTAPNATRNSAVSFGANGASPTTTAPPAKTSTTPTAASSPTSLHTFSTTSGPSTAASSGSSTGSSHVDTSATSIPVASPSPAVSAPESQLAFTGADIGGMVLFGLALIGSGVMLLRTRRRA